MRPRAFGIDPGSSAFARSDDYTCGALIRAWGVSETGPVRKTNEDCFIVDETASFFAVADGMGGHLAGEVAARLAIEAAAAFVEASKPLPAGDAGEAAEGNGAPDANEAWPYGREPGISRDGNRLRTAIYLANHRILDAAARVREYKGMGTTVVAVLVADATVAVGHVGDSRVYLWSNGALRQLTQDDSWVATVLAHDPGLTEQELVRHPMRNVLTNVLGAREQVDVHLSEYPFGEGDALLLSTDGLHGSLESDEMEEILRHAVDEQTAARRLVDEALKRGSRDNVTALVVRRATA